MGLSHPDYPLHGVQFHPESFLTPDGDAMLANFLRLGVLENPTVQDGKAAVEARARLTIH
jgi:hypothetical protein